MNLNEIIQKEEERHQLVRIGVITGLQDAINTLKDNYPQAELHTLNKKSVLQYFYCTVINYASFIDREKATNKTLKKWLFRKSSAILLTLQKGEKAPLDKELKTGSQLTVAYQLSDIIFESVYSSFCQSAQLFENPDETCAFFLLELKKRYPLYINEYVEMLGQGDPLLWEATCRYLQGLSYYVVKQFAGTFSQSSYRDIICDETWSRAYEVLKKRLVDREGNIPTFHTGNDFRNYMIKTCRYLAENLYKKYTEKAISFDELLSGFPYNGEDEMVEDENILPFEIEAASESEHLENAVKELDIDTDNAYEVAYAVSIILLNEGHALHRILVEGIEDKVELLINKAVHGMSYQEIVDSSPGNSTNNDVFRRAVARARKDFERTRKTLTGRLLKLVEKKGKQVVTSGNMVRCYK